MCVFSNTKHDSWSWRPATNVEGTYWDTFVQFEYESQWHNSGNLLFFNLLSNYSCNWVFIRSLLVRLDSGMQLGVWQTLLCIYSSAWKPKTTRRNYIRNTKFIHSYLLQLLVTHSYIKIELKKNISRPFFFSKYVWTQIFRNIYNTFVLIK